MKSDPRHLPVSPKRDEQTSMVRTRGNTLRTSVSVSKTKEATPWQAVSQPKAEGTASHPESSRIKHGPHDRSHGADLVSLDNCSVVAHGAHQCERDRTGSAGTIHPRPPDKMLHVDASSSDKFTLTWKQGGRSSVGSRCPGWQWIGGTPISPRKWWRNGTPTEFTAIRAIADRSGHHSHEQQRALRRHRGHRRRATYAKRAAETSANALPAFSVSFATD